MIEIDSMEGVMREVWRVMSRSIVFCVALAGCQDCSTAGPGTGSSGCCKVCKSGQACGDSCISTSQTCKVGGGCACNGEIDEFEVDADSSSIVSEGDQSSL